MNAENVKPYGKLVHDAAIAGGVDKFCESIEQNGYFKGSCDKEGELIPYLITMGIIAIAEGIFIGFRFVKDKKEQRTIKKLILETKAQQARNSLTNIMEKNVEEGDKDEEQDIVNEYTNVQDDIS